VSWYFGDNSHGDCLTEGFDNVQRRVRLEIVLLGHQRLPRFRALHSGGNTPTSCLVSYSQHTVATRLLEMYCLEVEEESDLPSLRVQAPLYRRGSGYRLGVRLPGCRLLHGSGLDVGPGVLCPLSGRRPLYKVPLSLGPASWEHMPPSLPRILSWRRVLPVGWWRSSVAGITPASCLCRSCRGHAAFGKAFVGGFHRLRWLRPLRMKSLAGCWRSQPFDGSRPPWPNIVVIPGTWPADGSALGLPE
jgi:hypothetical protein